MSLMGSHSKKYWSVVVVYCIVSLVSKERGLCSVRDTTSVNV